MEYLQYPEQTTSLLSRSGTKQITECKYERHLTQQAFGLITFA